MYIYIYYQEDKGQRKDLRNYGDSGLMSSELEL